MNLVRLRALAESYMDSTATIRRPTTVTADNILLQAIVTTTKCRLARPLFGMGESAIDAAALVPNADEVSIHFPFGTDVRAGDNIQCAGHVYAVRRILDDMTHQYDRTALTTRRS